MSFITYRNKLFVMNLINLQLSTIVWQKKKTYYTISPSSRHSISLLWWACPQWLPHLPWLPHPAPSSPAAPQPTRKQMNLCCKYWMDFFFFIVMQRCRKFLPYPELLNQVLLWEASPRHLFWPALQQDAYESGTSWCDGRKKKWETLQIHFLHINFDKHFTGRHGRRGRTSFVALMSQPAASNKWMTGMWLFFTARWRGVSWRWEQKNTFSTNSANNLVPLREIILKMSTHGWGHITGGLWLWVQSQEFVWSLHVFTVSVWILFRCPSFIPQSKNMRWNGKSELAVDV